ncbi:MAG: hypothetical protein AB7F61_19445 [Desulfobulbus sp.]|jgi:hypothetical protein
MKKIALFTALMLAFSFGSALAAGKYAADQDVIIKGTDGNLNLKLSNNVFLFYEADTSGDGLGYSIATYHSSGTRTYGSSSGDANIFWIDGTGSNAPTAPTGTASANFTGWTAL